MIPASVLAQSTVGTLFAWDPSLLITGFLLAGTLLLGAAVIAWVGRWRRSSEAESLTPTEQLAHFRSLYEQGALNQEEFERLRTLLGNQLRHDLDVPPAQAKQETGIQAAPGQAAVPPANGIVPPPEPPQDGIRPA